MYVSCCIKISIKSLITNLHLPVNKLLLHECLLQADEVRPAVFAADRSQIYSCESFLQYFSADPDMP